MIQTDLSLSAAGDSFELYSFQANKRGYKKVNLQTDFAYVHPNLRDAPECKTYEAVLGFLEKLQGTEGCRFYHQHNPRYPKHSSNIGFGLTKGSSHPCTIERMKEFVNKKIREKQNPHPTLDKVKRIARRILYGLMSGAKKVGRGAKWMTKGVALMIVTVALATISALPKLYLFDKGLMKVRRDKAFKLSKDLMRDGYCSIFEGVVKVADSIIGSWVYFSPRL